MVPPRYCPGRKQASVSDCRVFLPFVPLSLPIKCLNRARFKLEFRMKRHSCADLVVGGDSPPPGTIQIYFLHIELEKRIRAWH